MLFLIREKLLVVSDGKHRSDPSTAKRRYPRNVIVGIADATNSLNIISIALERILLRCWTNAEAVAVLDVYPNQSYNSFERLPPPMPISISSIVCNGSFLFLEKSFPGPLRMRLNLRRFSLLHGTMRTEHVLDMIFCSLGRPP